MLNPREDIKRGKREQRTCGTNKKQQQDDKLNYISIIRLNPNGPNTLIKSQKQLDQIKEQNPTICCLQEIHFKCKTQMG